MSGLRQIDSGRFTVTDRVTIIRAVQAAFDAEQRSVVERPADSQEALRVRLVNAGVRSIGCWRSDLRDVELQWLDGLARHIALGNRPAAGGCPGRGDDGPCTETPVSGCELDFGFEIAAGQCVYCGGDLS